MENLMHEAKQFAKAAHDAAGQRRKYTGEPYWHHCEEVAALVSAANGTDQMIAAAWLHDVVEDTEVRHTQIFNLFGAEVCELVMMLTDVSQISDGNRAERKAIDRAHTAQGSAAAKTIKLADLISNTKSIVEHDPDFAVVFMAEMRLLLPHLVEGSAVLYKQALGLLEVYYENRR